MVEFHAGEQRIFLVIMYLDHTILPGTKFANLPMPLESIVAESIPDIGSQELFKAFSLILSIGLFDLSMKTNICINASPAPESGRQGPVMDVYSFTACLSHAARDGDGNGRGRIMRMNLTWESL